MSYGEHCERARREPFEIVSESDGNPVANNSTSQLERGQESNATFTTRSDQGVESNIRTYVTEIDHLVELFRTGERTRFDVVSSVTRLLNGDTELSPQERAQSFELYMAEIGSIQETPRNKGKGPAHKRIVNVDARNPAIDSLGERGLEGSESGGEESSSSSDSEGEKPRKRRKLRQSDMPWSKRSGGIIPQNPSCVKTSNLIRKFNRDIKSTKLYIKLAPGAPRGIPMSEWEHIIKGEAVDLDKVLSSLHRVSVDSERKASVGDTEISISGVETKRKVETSSEWATSWRSASRAIAFVFEHREQELAEYGDYIERLFAAKRSSSHGQVILFDRGVRNEVGGGQSLLLTDYQYFTSLYAATLQDDGVEYHRIRRGGGNKSSGPKTEVCLRFNSQAGCRFSDSACKYQHSCLSCDLPGHGKTSCKKGN